MKTPPKVTVDGFTFHDLIGDGKLQPYEDTRLAVSRRVADLMPRLSTEEKISLLIGDGGYNPDNPDIGGGRGPVIGAAGITKALERHGIPAVVLTDGPAGVRLPVKRLGDDKPLYSTAFPVGTALACSWDVELVTRVGKCIGAEARDYGSDIQLTPGMNIMRNPLNGRNFEYFSEDPFVSGWIAAALINGVQSQGVASSAKHYATNNNETNRSTINVQASPRALREIYLRGFEIAVKEAKPTTIMTAYNKLNGEYVSASYDLLTTVLRDEWGYQGVVMTDWFGGYNVADIVAKDASKTIAHTQVAAGNDLLMPGLPEQTAEMLDAFKKGTFSTTALDKSVERILLVVFATPKMTFTPWSNAPDMKGHAAVTRQAATDGMVLLKNDGGTLPLKADQRQLAVFGMGAYHFIAGGKGSGFVNKAYTVSMLEGLTNAGCKLDEKVATQYDTFAKSIPDIVKPFGMNAASVITLPQPKLDAALIGTSAEAADAAVVCIGRLSSERLDRSLKDDYDLTADEAALIDAVSAAYHKAGKKVIVVLNVAAAVETTSWVKKADAVLLSWQPGQEGGNSVADVLLGKVNPSGRLTMTFPADYKDWPTGDEYPGLPLKNPVTAAYKEGVYVGYRYFSSFDKPVAFPFGYGLSYTTFTMSDINVSGEQFADKLVVTAKVTNTGSVAGREVAQLYLTAPAGEVDKPVAELKGFVKTRLLQPKESQQVTFVIEPKHLASFVPAKSAWVADAGKYRVSVAPACNKLELNTTFELRSPILAEKVNNVLNNAAFVDLKR